MDDLAYIQSATLTMFQSWKAVVKPVEHRCESHAAHTRAGLDTERKWCILNILFF
jgi:hypothetical protein